LSPTTRLRLAAVAAVLLLAILLAAQPPAEVPRRARSLATFGGKELAVRRLGGSGAAFDRRYFSFLENARRRLPPSATAVLLSGVPEDEPHLYLAAYQLAPRSVAFADREGHGPAANEIVLVYGRPPNASEHPLAMLPEGFLLSPP
jgi:hypothetical protein